jgi:hypothetical protein
MASSSNIANPISTETNPQSPSPNLSPASLSSFAQSISKLTQTNFLVWHHQIETYLHGHDLYGFVDGTKTPPHPYSSTSADGSLTISTDPSTLQWFRQDQLILSMLVSIISDELLPQKLGCRTAQEL